MELAPRLETFLAEQNAHYSLIHHTYTTSAFDAASAAHLPTSNMVKGVMLEDEVDGQFVIAAIPANHRVKLAWVNQILNRKLVLADEAVSKELFPDCQVGAIPGVAQAYGLELIWEEELKLLVQLYFEAGNHEHLIQLDNAQFTRLFDSQPCGIISTLREYSSVYRSDFKPYH